MNKNILKSGISIGNRLSTENGSNYNNIMATKIRIPKQLEVNLQEKEVHVPRLESALNFIREEFPGKFNFTIDEAAKLLNISYDFVREHIVQKEIKATQYGDRWMIGLHELARILSEGV